MVIGPMSQVSTQKLLLICNSYMITPFFTRYLRIKTKFRYNIRPSKKFLYKPSILGGASFACCCCSISTSSRLLRAAWMRKFKRFSKSYPEKPSCGGKRNMESFKNNTVHLTNERIFARVNPYHVRRIGHHNFNTRVWLICQMVVCGGTHPVLAVSKS